MAHCAAWPSLLAIIPVVRSTPACRAPASHKRGADHSPGSEANHANKRFVLHLVLFALASSAHVMRLHATRPALTGIDRNRAHLGLFDESKAKVVAEGQSASQLADVR